MLKISGQARWRELSLEIVQTLWKHCTFDNDSRCYLWMTDIHGAGEYRVMALHGLPGIVFPMREDYDTLRPNRGGFSLNAFRTRST